MWLFPVFVAVDIDSREPGFGSWSSRSLQTFPEDLVVEFGWNAVFSREVEVAGFLRPVLRVMSRLQVGTGSELDLLWIQSQCCRLQKRRCDGMEGPRARRLDVEDICHRPRIISVQVDVLRAQDVLDRAEHIGL